MLNPNGADIYSAGLTEFANLIYDIVVTKSPKGRNVSKLWEKAYKIIPILESLQVVDNLGEESANAFYNCLVEILQLYDLSSYPSLIAPSPIIINTGPVGPAGSNGSKGDTGGGYSFNAGTISSTTAVNSFNVSLAYAARWDYIVNGTSQRAGSIIATWLEDGSGIDWSDTSTPDVNGSTSGIEFTVTFSTGQISLNAVITSGTWAISGTRYFIPESGTFVSVASTLSNGKFFIGNTSNQPQERTISGVIAITNTGISSFFGSPIFDANINSTAAISLSKLASIGNNKVAITNGLGVLIAHATTTPTEIGYLTGVLNPIQSQIDSKQNIITGAASTITTLNLAFNFVLVSHPITGKVVVSGTSGDKLSFLNGVTSDIQAQLDTKVSAGSGTLTTTVVNIGTWDMDTVGTVDISHGIVDFTRIRGVDVIIRDDAGTTFYKLFDTAGATLPAGGSGGITSTTIRLVRVAGQTFDSTSFDLTAGSYNRGWITIVYLA